MTKEWAIKGKGDVRVATEKKTRATAQVGLTYDIAPQTVFDVYYRVEKEPSRMNDLTGVGLLYRF